MTKKIVIWIFICIALMAWMAFGQVSRPITETWDISISPQSYEPIYWLQGESIEFDLTVMDGADYYTELTNADVYVVWEIVATNSITNAFILDTGTIVNATNGNVAFSLTANEANITNGTYYGFVRAFVLDGGDYDEMAVLSRQKVFVQEAPSGLEYAYVSPLTNMFWNSINTNAANLLIVSNDIAVLQASTSNWNTAYTAATGTLVTATNDIATEVRRLWKHYRMDKLNGDDVVVDCIGIGTGVGSNLTSTGYPVVRYKGGAKSDSSKQYRNRRVQSYLVLRDRLREGDIVIADRFVDDDEWDDVCGQLCSIRRKVGQETVEDLATKEEMKNQSLPSPDRADSMAMQYATQAPEIPVGDIGAFFMGQQMETAHYDGSISQ